MNIRKTISRIARAFRAYRTGKTEHILIVTYYHQYGTIPHDESARIAEHYRRTILDWKRDLPSSVLLLCMSVMTQEPPKVEIILSSQITRTDMNDATKFFDDEAE